MQLWLGAIVLSIIPLSLLKLVTHQMKEKKSETHQIRDKCDINGDSKYSQLFVFSTHFDPPPLLSYWWFSAILDLG